MSLAMTREERERFLADLHVGVLAVADGDHGPLTLPIWYAYEPGAELWLVTDRDSHKGKLIAKAKRFSLCAQTETAPYRYVSVEGPVVAIETAEVERDLRPMARRYLGTEVGDAYVKETAGEDFSARSILVRMRPERWRTVDYSKEYG